MVIVGAGTVAARKARALYEAGAVIRIIAPSISPELQSLSLDRAKISILVRDYAGREDLRDADLVLAATSSRNANETIAADARSLHRLVNVVSAPAKSTFTSMAVHRAGELTVGVAAGRLPGAAARIRDEIAARFDGRYAAALTTCARLRQRMLSSSRRQSWREMQRKLFSEDFPARVESGAFNEEIASWR